MLYLVMPSVVPRFEYGIFISYRSKDNKGKHWVSEFVNVSKSLAKKLKCLIFISIIAQTYCDPKSYGRQYEFSTLNKMVSEDDDPFGRDIKLKNGNVAGRILPVNIHDLDQFPQ